MDKMFSLYKCIDTLGRTPAILTHLLSDMSEDIIYKNEGKGTWSPYDVIGHLIHGEKTDWIPRLNIILEFGEQKTFEPFDRFAQFENSKEKNITTLLLDFTRLRKSNLRILEGLNLDDKALLKKGLHPDFGPVTVRELLSAWMVHDLGHIVQVSRVIARQHKSAVGPWVKYLSILN